MPLATRRSTLSSGWSLASNAAARPAATSGRITRLDFGDVHDTYGSASPNSGRLAPRPSVLVGCPEPAHHELLGHRLVGGVAGQLGRVQAARAQRDRLELGQLAPARHRAVILEAAGRWEHAGLVGANRL